MTAPRERPILFSGAMVRAILGGQKTQTRRPVTPQPSHDQLHEWRGKRVHDSEHCTWCWRGNVLGDDLWDFANGEARRTLASLCPFGAPGDRLWVRETWQFADWTLDGEPFIGYRADDAQELRYPDSDEWGERLANVWADLSADGRQPAADLTWRPSIHMPRWASRLTLEVSDVRVERLQEISEDDAITEGFEPRTWGTWWQGYRDIGEPGAPRLIPQDIRGDDGPPDWMIDPKREDMSHLDQPATAAFFREWAGVYGNRCGDNPWVWGVEFRRVEVAP